MGVVHKPTVQDYWSTHPVLSTTFAPRHMKRDRFTMILSIFHLNDNSTYIAANTEGHDPFHKIRPFYDSLRCVFTETYLPDENICIDEAMCPWRGRVDFRVYMKDKPIKWGIKLFVGMPKDLKTNLTTGEVDYRRNNQVLALHWKDKRQVTLLTTKHLPTMREVVSRAETNMKPDVVIDYTKFMKGVNHSDQMVSYIPLLRKTLKWWKKLTFHHLTLVMVQAHWLYNKHRRVHRLSKMITL